MLLILIKWLKLVLPRFVCLFVLELFVVFFHVTCHSDLRVFQFISFNWSVVGWLVAFSLSEKFSSNST